jgi:hypothetical protein
MASTCQCASAGFRREWTGAVRERMIACVLLRLALLVLFVLFLAWYEPSPRGGSLPLPVREEAETPVALTLEQVRAQSERCDRTSRDVFRREWQDGVVDDADGLATADYASHYNAKLRVCYYLLAIESGQAGAAARTLHKLLFDVDERELYGEYLGAEPADSPAAGTPKACRVAGFYCASAREWDVLARRFMED